MLVHHHSELKLKPPELKKAEIQSVLITDFSSFMCPSLKKKIITINGEVRDFKAAKTYINSRPNAL